MGLQAEFEKFDEKIRLSDSDLEDLRTKRDVLLGKLRDSDDLPVFKEFSQGSYAMHLGVKPTDDREFDIDVALRFQVDKEEADPFEYKQTIYDILKHLRVDQKVLTVFFLEMEVVLIQDLHRLMVIIKLRH